MTRGEAAPIRPAAAVAVTALVGVGLMAALWLLAYGGEFAKGARPAPGPASKAAEGFYGLTVLLRAEGVATVVVRAAGAAPADALLILALGPGDAAQALRPLAGRRALVILPKWRRGPDPRHPGWSGEGAPDLAAATLLLRALAGPSRVSAFPPPRNLVWGEEGQGAPRPPLDIPPISPLAVMTGPRLTPILTDPRGAFVVAQVEGTQICVLSDPDLLDNQGLLTLEGATAASLIVRRLAGEGSVAFLGARPTPATRNAARLLFERPFGAAAVCLSLAALLAAVQAFMRFGPAAPAERAYAFGKRALVESAASLLEAAGREPSIAPRYLELAARRTAAALGLHEALDPPARNAALERLAARRGLPPLAGLLARARALKTRRELLAWAIDLHHWSEEMVRGRP